MLANQCRGQCYSSARTKVINELGNEMTSEAKQLKYHLVKIHLKVYCEKSNSNLDRHNLINCKGVLPAQLWKQERKWLHHA